MRSMNHKLVGCFVEGGSGFKATNIRSMTNLSLSISSKDSCVLAERHPLGFLLICHHGLEGKSEHGEVEVDRVLTKMRIRPVHLTRVAVDKPLVFAKLPCQVNLAIQVSHLFLPGHLIELVVVHESRVAHLEVHRLDVSLKGRFIENVVEISGEILLVSFFLEVTCYDLVFPRSVHDFLSGTFGGHY